MNMDELDALIAGDSIGAPLNQDDIALARALVNSGVAGDVDIVGDELDDVGAEIDIVGADPMPMKNAPRATVTTAQLRRAIEKKAMRIARQMTGGVARGGAPVAVEKKVDGSETETAYLSIYRDATNG